MSILTPSDIQRMAVAGVGAILIGMAFVGGAVVPTLAARQAAATPITPAQPDG